MAVTPHYDLGLFTPLGVGWREDATAGALLDADMMLIDAALYELSQSSPSGSANQVVATPNGSSGVSALRKLVQSDMPNNMSMFGNLPNVKLVPSYNIFMPSASGPNFYPIYTVPSGRRALLSQVVHVVMGTNTPSAYGIEEANLMVNIGGTYYPLGDAYSTVVGAPLTGTTDVLAACAVGPYIAEAGETFVVGTGAGTSSQVPLLPAYIVLGVAAAVTTTLTLSSVSAVQSGVAVYTGTITSGASNAFAGYTFVVTGFSNASNNGTFMCIGSSVTTLLLVNTNSILESTSASASTTNTTYNGQFQTLMAGQYVNINAPWGATSNNGTFMVVGSSTASAVTVNNTAGTFAASFVLTSVATSVGSTAVYTGAITGGGSNAYAGQQFVISGFSGANNNGLFTCSASTATSLTLSNAAATSETHAARAETLSLTDALTSVSSPVGATAVYNGTITGGANNGLASVNVFVSGFINAANNGCFTVVSSSATTLTLYNPSATPETASATAYFGWSVISDAAMTPLSQFSIVASIIEFDNTAPVKSVKATGFTTGVNQSLYTPSYGKNGALVGAGLLGGQQIAPQGTIYCCNGSTSSISTALYYIGGASVAAPLLTASTAANGYTLYRPAPGYSIPFGGAGNNVAPVTAITAYTGALTLTSVAAINTLLDGNEAIYTGTITGGANNALSGQEVVISGFSNPSNNGLFSMTNTTATSFQVVMPAGSTAVNEVHAATATGVAILTGTFNSINTVGQYVLVNGFVNTNNNGIFKVLSGSTIINNQSATTETHTATACVQYLYGAAVTISGFTHAGNNGTFSIVASSDSFLLVANSNGVSESNSGATMSILPVPCISNRLATISTSTYTAAATALPTGLLTVANGDSLVIVPTITNNNSICWTNVIEF